MNNKFKKLEDLAELYKSNAITKDEFEILKEELLSSNEDNLEAAIATNHNQQLGDERIKNEQKPIAPVTQKNNNSGLGAAIFSIVLVAIIFLAVKVSTKDSLGVTPPVSTPLYNNSINTTPSNNTTSNSIPENQNNSEVTQEDISLYICKHSFSINGNGDVAFSRGILANGNTGGTIMVTGGRFTLQGNWYKTGSNSVQLSDIYALDDGASNNGACFGTLYLNSDGTLNETLSDGQTQYNYVLSPK